MEFKTTDYEINENCFDKTRDVESILLYGEENNKKNVLFTILIPTYKRYTLFKEALYSVVNQWHVSFEWEILVLDNEEYSGKENDNERLIKSYNNPKIRYYRNTKTLRPGDNFNRGILLAKGKWVMMLHDDDILFLNSLRNMSNVLTALQRVSHNTIGGISAKYYQIKYDINNPENFYNEMRAVQGWFLNQPTNYGLYKITHKNVLFTGHVGADVPSNGTTFLREAVIDVGGFNDDFGISADLILFYNLANQYDVYSTVVPYGFYRWGANTMSKVDSVYKVIKFGFDFRNYIYQKNAFNRLWGVLFKKSQHRRFTIDVLRFRKIVIDDKVDLKRINEIYSIYPNKYLYTLYALLVKGLYKLYQDIAFKSLYKNMMYEVNKNSDNYL